MCLIIQYEMSMQRASQVSLTILILCFRAS